MKDNVEIDGLLLRVVDLTGETVVAVSANPNGPEIVPDVDAVLSDWEQ